MNKKAAILLFVIVFQMLQVTFTYAWLTESPSDWTGTPLIHFNNRSTNEPFSYRNNDVVIAKGFTFWIFGSYENGRQYGYYAINNTDWSSLGWTNFTLISSTFGDYIINSGNPDDLHQAVYDASNDYIHFIAEGDWNISNRNFHLVLTPNSNGTLTEEFIEDFGTQIEVQYGGSRYNQTMNWGGIDVDLSGRPYAVMWCSPSYESVYRLRGYTNGSLHHKSFIDHDDSNVLQVSTHASNTFSPQIVVLDDGQEVIVWNGGDYEYMIFGDALDPVVDSDFNHLWSFNFGGDNWVYDERHLHAHEDRAYLTCIVEEQHILYVSVYDGVSHTWSNYQYPYDFVYYDYSAMQSCLNPEAETLEIIYMPYYGEGSEYQKFTRFHFINSSFESPVSLNLSSQTGGWEYNSEYVNTPKTLPTILTSDPGTHNKRYLPMVMDWIKYNGSYYYDFKMAFFPVSSSPPTDEEEDEDADDFAETTLEVVEEPGDPYLLSCYEDLYVNSSGAVSTDIINGTDDLKANSSHTFFIEFDISLLTTIDQLGIDDLTITNATIGFYRYNGSANAFNFTLRDGLLWAGTYDHINESYIGNFTDYLNGTFETLSIGSQSPDTWYNSSNWGVLVTQLNNAVENNYTYFVISGNSTGDAAISSRERGFSARLYIDWNKEDFDDDLYSYTLRGQYYENGPVGVNETVNIVSEYVGMDTVQLGSGETLTIWCTSPVLRFLWFVTNVTQARRIDVTNCTNEVYYVFEPESQASTYELDVQDYSGLLPAYLEVYRQANSSLRMLSRVRNSAQDHENDYVLVPGATYYLKLRTEDCVLYDLGPYVPGDDDLTVEVEETDFTDSHLNIWEWITADATRYNSSAIRLTYQDLLTSYESLTLDWSIYFRNGTSAWNSSTLYNVSSNTQYWNSMNNSLSYYVEMHVDHEYYGDIYRTWILDHTYSFNSFPDLDALGTWGFDATNLLALFMGFLGMAVCSYFTRAIAPFMGVTIIAVITFMGGASFSSAQIGIGFTLSIIAAIWLSGGRG